MLQTLWSIAVLIWLKLQYFVLLYLTGSQPLLPSIQQEDTQTEKRIAHILQEAQQAMQHKKVMEQVWNSEVRYSFITFTLLDNSGHNFCCLLLSSAYVLM